jgi:osmotically inducible protein OsmC
MPTRKASAIWEGGGLKTGRGSFRGHTGAISGSYSFGSRFEESAGSNPEELLAAAEAACFSMALSAGLERAGHPPTKIETEAACTIEKGAEGMTVTRIVLTAKAAAPGIDPAAFKEAVDKARDTCPISRALKGNVAIEVNATLL